MGANLGVIYQALYGGLDKLVLLAPVFNIAKLPREKKDQLENDGFLQVTRYFYEDGKQTPKSEKLPRFYYLDSSRFNYNQLAE